MEGFIDVADAFKKLSTFLLGIVCEFSKTLADALVFLSQRLKIIPDKIVNEVIDPITQGYLSNYLQYLYLVYDLLACVLNPLMELKDLAGALCFILAILNCFVNGIISSVLSLTFSLTVHTHFFFYSYSIEIY